MQGRTPLSPVGAPRPVSRRCSRTYLATIAGVLQHCPDKMLTFTELMDKLEAFVTGDRKAFVNNIRVCLSTSKCFVKVPMNPETPNCKINYWKLDHSQITAKMVRRHFKGVVDQFPELAAKLRPTEDPAGSFTASRSPAPTACKAGAATGGSFSMESLLKRDSPRGLNLSASRVKQQAWPTGASNRWLNWGAVSVETHFRRSDGRHLESTWSGRDCGLGGRPFGKMCRTETPFPIPLRPSMALYFPSPQRGYLLNDTVFTFVQDAHHFRL